jgi:hypothetical protein
VSVREPLAELDGEERERAVLQNHTMFGRGRPRRTVIARKGGREKRRKPARSAEFWIPTEEELQLSWGKQAIRVVVISGLNGERHIHSRTVEHASGIGAHA